MVFVPSLMEALNASAQVGTISMTKLEVATTMMNV